ncbi:MAG: gene transfer agent family protein [Notoacmeibacter sp.]|nr:gene transfer agent family protein [Notoacmeibacter sp.]
MAVNRRRGEVEAVIDGKPLRLCLTLGALAELEDAFGASDLQALAGRFAGGRLSARDLLVIAAAGLRGGGNDVSDAQAAAMTVEGGVAGWAAIAGDLLRAAFGTPGEAAEQTGGQGDRQRP